MRRSLLPLLLLVAAACTSTKSLPGRYAVMFDPELTRQGPGGAFSEHVTNALRERLGSVELVQAPPAGGYDAVILVRPAGRTVASNTASVSRGTIETPPNGRPFRRSGAYDSTLLIEFDIVRGGRTVESGVARLEGNAAANSIERSGSDTLENRPVNRHNEYERSRTVAIAVVDALKRSNG